MVAFSYSTVQLRLAERLLKNFLQCVILSKKLYMLLSLADWRSTHLEVCDGQIPVHFFMHC